MGFLFSKMLQVVNLLCQGDPYCQSRDNNNTAHMKYELEDMVLMTDN